MCTHSDYSCIFLMFLKNPQKKTDNFALYTGKLIFVWFTNTANPPTYSYTHLACPPR